MSISVAIIMKNEESVLARCLGCVSKFADEVVVVDTGSTDKSKEIAATFPKVKLFDSEFFNKDTHFSDFEFGKAKNEAIKKCTGDWVFWFDCDDFMDDENIAKLVKIANEETRVCLYGFHIHYGPLRFEHCRMFKNGANILFDEFHACHEYLNTLGHPLIARLDVVIQHLPGHKGVASHSRNLAILEKDYYVRKREDPRTLFYLANAYREAGQFDKAVEFYDKYLVVSKWAEERFFARHYKAQALWRQGNINEARNEALRTLTEDFRFAEPYCFLGDVAMANGDPERAMLWYKMAMSTPYPKDARLFVSTSSYSEYPAKRMGECMKLIGLTGDNLPGPQSAPTSEPVKVEIPKRKERFSLPADRGLAMLAVQALSSCVTTGKAEIEVVVADAWQEAIVCRFHSLRIGQGPAKTLSLPANLKGLHATEWFVKSAGFVGVQQTQVDCKAAIPREKKVIVTDGACALPDKVLQLTKGQGKELVVLKEDAKLEDALLLMGNSAAFIGKEGWLQHLAEWLRVPAFVIFNGHNPTEYGWPDQQNRATDDLAGMEEFVERSLKV